MNAVTSTHPATAVGVAVMRYRGLMLVRPQNSRYYQLPIAHVVSGEHSAVQAADRAIAKFLPWVKLERDPRDDIVKSTWFELGPIPERQGKHCFYRTWILREVSYDQSSEMWEWLQKVLMGESCIPWLGVAYDELQEMLARVHDKTRAEVPLDSPCLDREPMLDLISAEVLKRSAYLPSD